MDDLPNEIISEIFGYIEFDELKSIPVNRISHRIRDIIIGTNLIHRTNKNFRYLIEGYKFTKCKLKIKQFGYYPGIEFDKYQRGLRNLRFCRDLTLKYNFINRDVINLLPSNIKVVFKRCSFQSFTKDDYPLLKKFKSISFVRCTRLLIPPLKNFNIKKLDSSDVKPNYLKYLSNVSYLKDFNSNIITDDDLEKFTNIKRIHIRMNDRITDAGLKALANAHTVELVCCSNITDTGLAHLANVTKLKIYLCNGITDRGLSYLTGVKSLKLNTCNNITDAGLKNLTTVSNLKSLTLIQLNITNVGLSYLKDIPKIKLNELHGVGDEGLANLSHVNKLCIESCRLITNWGLLYLKNVKNLQIKSCENITDRGLRKLKSVTKLEIYDLPNVRGRFVTRLKHLNELKVLEIIDKKFNFDYLKKLQNLNKLTVHSDHINDLALILNDLIAINKLIILTSDEISNYSREYGDYFKTKYVNGKKVSDHKLKYYGYNLDIAKCSNITLKN